MAKTKEEKKAERKAKKQQRQRSNTARELRRMIYKFMQDERFAEVIATGLPVYWNGRYAIENAIEMSLNETSRYYDWLFYDFQPDEETPRLVETFAAEMEEELTEYQQEILAEWQDAPAPGAYEYLGYNGFSHEFKLRDFLTGEELVAKSDGGFGKAKLGDLILVRLVPVGEEWEFSTVAAYLPQEEIGDLKAQLAAAQVEDKKAFPEGTQADFLRRHSQLIIHYAMDQAEANGRYPVDRLDPANLNAKTKRTIREIQKKVAKRKKKR